MGFETVVFIVVLTMHARLRLFVHPGEGRLVRQLLHKKGVPCLKPGSLAGAQMGVKTPYLFSR